MGLPKALTPTQLTQLQQATRDTPEQDTRIRVGADGLVEVNVPMRSNDVVTGNIGDASLSAAARSPAPHHCYASAH